jgi:hypothetical protein
MTDIDLIKQALEYLEDNQHHIADHERHTYVMMYNDVITALKARLAQPEQTEVQQLIALVRAQQITIDKLEMALADHPMREVQRLGQEIEQEPTAKYSDIVSDGGFDPRNKFDAPPQRTDPLIGCVNHDCAKCKLLKDERLELIGHADLAINNIYIFNGYGEDVPEDRTPIYAGYKAAHGIKETT